MGEFSEYRIGRQDAEIEIDDPGVSKRHAELVATEDGRFYLTDCGSTSGTHVHRDSGWCRIQQDFVRPEEKILLGRRTFTPPQLLALVKSTGGVPVDAVKHDKSSPGNGRGAAKSRDPKDDLPAGRVKRDPVSGEIVPAGADDEQPV